TIDVREHNNEIVFMHKIVPGVANRSYGIHVARMAGMPSSVIARAECVLSALESSEPVRPAPTCAPAPKPIRKKAVISDNLPQPQLNLFG
ncbi:MAG: DNA mismatch repair protein MutS, partial [Pseudomonadota bacterium]|nr:DNA mismatch repair protein MutS [Pseudomonadota bacterium]